MNIIKIENGTVTNTTIKRIEVKSKYSKNNNNTDATIIVLSDEDINNENSYLKLKGVKIHTLLIPKKYRFTFNQTPIYNYIAPQFSLEIKISYY